MDSADIFISYSHLDDPDFARGLSKILKGRGFRTWIDEASLKHGENLFDKIVKAIRASGLYIPIISKGFCDESRWAFKEFKEAIDEEAVRFGADQQDRFILPILYNMQDTKDVSIINNEIISKYLEGKLYISINTEYAEVLKKYVIQEEENPSMVVPGSVSKLVNGIIEATGIVQDVFVETNNKNIMISRFPVTNLEYKRFIKSNGYKLEGIEKWWSSEGLPPISFSSRGKPDRRKVTVVAFVASGGAHADPG